MYIINVRGHYSKGSTIVHVQACISSIASTRFGLHAHVHAPL